MTYGIIALIVVGAGLTAGVLSWFARRLIPLETLRRHRDVGSAVFLQLGVIFAVLLAFVINDVWGEYNVAAQAINHECGSLHGAAILADTLPSPLREDLERGLRVYVADVIGMEWPSMAHRRVSRPTREALQAVWTAIARASPGDARTQSVSATIMQLLARAHQDRETRLFEMTLGVPALLWCMLLFFAALLTGFIVALGIESAWSQVLFVALFAGAITLALMTVRVLDFPFEGPVRLQATDFQQTLHRIDLLIAAGSVAR